MGILFEGVILDETLSAILYVGLLVIGALWLKGWKVIREDEDQDREDERGT